MGKKSSEKKARQAVAAEPVQVISTVTEPHLESYVYGWLQSRGFDLYPKITQAGDTTHCDLYFNCGDKGWRLVYRVNLDTQKIPQPRTIGHAIALSHQLDAGGAPKRTPAPMGEELMKQIRNGLLGVMQDGGNMQEIVGSVQTIIAAMTNHLRPAPMELDFGDGEEAEEGEDDTTDAEEAPAPVALSAVPDPEDGTLDGARAAEGIDPVPAELSPEDEARAAAEAVLEGEHLTDPAE